MDLRPADRCGNIKKRSNMSPAFQHTSVHEEKEQSYKEAMDAVAKHIRPAAAQVGRKD